MLMGEFHHNLDDKGRLIIPSKFRNELGDKVIITKGLDKCLFIYSLEEWNKIINRISNLQFTKKSVRTFQRMFIGSASLTEFDKQGRINITSPLVQYANIDHECIIVGVNERLEIWSILEFNNYMKENINILEEISEDIFDNSYEA